MKKTLILASFLALAPFAKGQLLLEALDAPNAFTSTQTRSASGNFTKNDCSEVIYRGTSVTYTQSATATATSYISQQDADNKATDEAAAEAQKLVNQGGQAFANINGKCEAMDGCAMIAYNTSSTGSKSVVDVAHFGNLLSPYDCLDVCGENADRLRSEWTKKGLVYDEYRCYWKDVLMGGNRLK